LTRRQLRFGGCVILLGSAGTDDRVLHCQVVDVNGAAEAAAASDLAPEVDCGTEQGCESGDFSAGDWEQPMDGAGSLGRASEGAGEKYKEGESVNDEDELPSFFNNNNILNWMLWMKLKVKR
jgi:hypothetical protein